MFSRLFHTNRHNIKIIANALIYVVLPSTFAINFNSSTRSYNDSGNETVEKFNQTTKTESITTTNTDIIAKVSDAAGEDNLNEASDSNYDDEPYIYDKDWDERKTGCTFCNSFIRSPCNVQFQRWSKCIDDSKSKNEDYADFCTKYTKALTDCCDQYTDYFNFIELFEEDDDDSGEDDYDDFKEDGRIGEETSEEALSESSETAIIIPPTLVLATTSNNTTSQNDGTVNNDQSDK